MKLGKKLKKVLLVVGLQMIDIWVILLKFWLNLVWDAAFFKAPQANSNLQAMLGTGALDDYDEDDDDGVVNSNHPLLGTCCLFETISSALYF